MGIDRETKASVFIDIPNDKEFIKRMKDEANSTYDDEDKDKHLLLTDSLGTFDVDEYYFSESENELCISGKIAEAYVSVSIPLSDILLIDILGHSIKKLNKLKVALESLK